MQVETWLTPSSAAVHERDAAEVAVVIDVLRATTVATTALAAGAASITTCETVEQAHAWQAERSAAGEAILLCGERECKPIEGFDFGNSPGEYSPAGVQDRHLVLTTTNGTQAIHSAQDCDHCLLGCFANVGAVAEQVIALLEPTTNTKPRVRLICAGTNGAVTGEDVLMAGALISLLHRKLSGSARFHDGPIELVNDSSEIALAVWQHCIALDKVTDSETLAQKLATTQGGKNLIAADYESDLIDCGSIDVFDNVPQRLAREPYARFTNASSAS